MKTLLINYKNYSKILGEGSLKLALEAQKAAKSTGKEVIVAPPHAFLRAVASKVTIPVFAQSVDNEWGEKTTGAVTPEGVKGAGASGTLLNHSERRVPREELERIVPKLNDSRIRVCLCARTPGEAGQLSRLGPEFLAVEPPELIGSGIAVSKAKPEVIMNTVQAARQSGYRGKILCGAGIMSGKDVRRAVELGAEGVLVSSGVVLASDWLGTISELASSL